VGEELLKPLWGIVEKPVQSESLPSDSLLKVSGDISVSAVKMSDDGKGLVVRVFETEGREGEVVLELPVEVGQVFRTKITEEDPVEIGGKGKKLSLKVGTQSIETWLFRPAR
jgi:alpha-mannosidase